jgi:multisubunit Na+/H+ antiporter MnhB subunit
MAEGFFTVVLCGLLIGLAGFVTLERDHFAATVGFIALGLVLALAWMLLAAPDVAITEAALGGGVMGALLLVAGKRLQGAEEDLPAGRGLRGAAALLCAGVTVALIAVVWSLPVPAPTLAPEAVTALPPTGLHNPVTGVLMAFRALDTMMEKVVLLLALGAVWSLTADAAWSEPTTGRVAPADGPLRLLARALIPFGLVVGGYLFWVGADEPGGAFAGGAVISAMVLLAILAGVRRGPPVTDRVVRVLLAVGVLAFLVCGLAGMATGRPFLSYPADWAKPVIVALEVAMTVSVGATLAMFVLGPPQRSSP